MCFTCKVAYSKEILSILKENDDVYLIEALLEMCGRGRDPGTQKESGGQGFAKDPNPNHWTL